jgi:hypothetical protein
MPQPAKAIGYLLILIPPVLLTVSAALGIPWLTFAVLIGILPLMRVLFGDTDRAEQNWSERIATLLDRLPRIYAVLAPVVMGYVLVRLSAVAQSVGMLVWWGASLWGAFIFASCVAHELVHHRDHRSRQAGRILSGIIGYPLLEHEHRAHHAASGNVDAAEWPRVNENVWQFSVRRLRRVAQSAWDSDHASSVRAGRRLAGGLPLALLSFGLTAVAFTVAGGLSGFCLYVVVAAAVAWSIQAIPYVQHWGLGPDSAPHAAVGVAGLAHAKYQLPPGPPSRRLDTVLPAGAEH